MLGLYLGALRVNVLVRKWVLTGVLHQLLKRAPQQSLYDLLTAEPLITCHAILHKIGAFTYIERTEHGV